MPTLGGVYTIESVAMHAAEFAVSVDKAISGAAAILAPGETHLRRRRLQEERTRAALVEAERRLFAGALPVDNRTATKTAAADPLGGVAHSGAPHETGRQDLLRRVTRTAAPARREPAPGK